MHLGQSETCAGGTGAWKKDKKTKIYEKIKNIEEEKNKQTKYMCKVYMYLGQK